MKKKRLVNFHWRTSILIAPHGHFEFSQNVVALHGTGMWRLWIGCVALHGLDMWRRLLIY